MSQLNAWTNPLFRLDQRYDFACGEIEALQRRNAEMRAKVLALQSCQESAAALIEECRAALSAELTAWDIEPPLHHIKQAHDKCVAWLAKRQPAPKGGGTV